MSAYFGVGIYNGKNPENMGSLWRSAQCFGASYLFTIGRRYPSRRPTDTMNAAANIPLFEFATLDDFLLSNPGKPELVGVELVDASLPLESFNHPKHATYLLGAEDSGLPENVLRACSRVVRIPGKLCLNVGVAGSIVLYDRAMKARKSRAE